MRPWILPALCLPLLSLGCGHTVAPALQPGDVVRPEVSFAPKEPWPAEAKATVGVLLRVERPGGGSRYLRDEDVLIERAVMSARFTFLDGERVVDEPREVPLIHDC